jgi:hypothetical protein
MNLADLPFRGDVIEEERVQSKWPRGYTGWGPGEDAMYKEGDWWTDTQYVTADEFVEGWGVDHLNIIVDFYFGKTCDSEGCKACDSSGYNPETKKISDDFYDFAHTGGKWCHKITQDEVEELVRHGRLGAKWDKAKNEGYFPEGEMPTADEINAKNVPGARAMGHDAINRWILIETRAKRLGVWGKCEACDGKGRIRKSEDYFFLNVWMIHPRKGAARGIQVTHVTDEHLPKIKAMLNKSWRLHQQHFAWALDAPELVAKEDE